MVKGKSTNRQRQTYIGLGIALGFSIGSVLGGLPLPGNIGWLMGGSLGMGLGIIVGSIADSLNTTPLFTLIGMPAGMLFSVGLGLAIDLVFHTGGYAALGGWFGLTAGLVIGTLLDVRKKQYF